jgi:EAL domain-containing protein (putative c-di-GMP-specific phosphodiesterase class I)
VIEVIADPRGVLAEGGLQLYGQEIFDLESGRRAMTELLLRESQCDGDAIAPGELLAAAEADGTIGEIDLWVLGQALPHTAAGHAVSVNIASRTLEDPRLVPTLERLLSISDARPELLTFEITETAKLNSFAKARRNAGALTALGCRLALDDFGTGYGTLCYLEAFPAKYLKIDRAFVRDAMTDDRSLAVIESIIWLADRFGQETIAEGIECPDTLQLVSSLGINYAQGFYLGRPWPIAQVLRRSVADRHG